MFKNTFMTLTLCFLFAFKVTANSPFIQNQNAPLSPQEDFYHYVNGGWIQDTQIPEDRTQTGTFIEMLDQNEIMLNNIIADLAHAPSLTPQEEKILAVYNSMMDTTAREALSLSPLEPEMNIIHAIQDPDSLIQAMAHLHKLGVNVPLSLQVRPDLKDATAYTLYFSQSGLTLPNRDYYLKQEEPFITFQNQFIEYITAILKAAEIDEAEQKAKLIYELEFQLAQAHWSEVDSRNYDKIYNKQNFSGFAYQYPDLETSTFFKAIGYHPTEYVIVTQPSYFKALNQIITQTPLSTWKAYLQFHVLNQYAPFINQTFENIHFEFNERILSGKEKNDPKSRQAINLVNTVVGDLLGQAFVKKHFSQADKEVIDALVQHLLSVYDAGIDQLTWMSADTKKAAKKKLQSITVKIGFPETWKSYEGLRIDPTHLIENIKNASNYEFNREFNKLGKKVDRSEWFMNAQKINAYYAPTQNAIVFPAAILQPPLFDSQGELERNYGGIGAIIGHEISHAFDDQGRKFDALGNLEDWWHPSDAEKFETLTLGLINQYNQYSPIPGMSVNGELTLGENIADLSGLSVALKALQQAKAESTLSPKTPDYGLFFESWANVWRSKIRDGELRQRLLTDPHSPNQYRTNGILRNIPEFYETYPIHPSDQMYLAPEERIQIW